MVDFQEPIPCPFLNFISKRTDDLEQLNFQLQINNRTNQKNGTGFKDKKGKKKSFGKKLISIFQSNSEDQRGAPSNKQGQNSRFGGIGLSEEQKDNISDSELYGSIAGNINRR